MTKFNPRSFQVAEIARSAFRMQVPVSFEKKDLTESENWRDIVAAYPMIQIGNIIEVLREDYEFFANLLVVGKSKDEIFLKIITFTEFSSEKLNEESAYEILWKGPNKKFAIIRKSDQKEMRDKFTSRDEAKSHIKNL